MLKVQVKHVEFTSWKITLPPEIFTFSAAAYNIVRMRRLRGPAVA
jgi:hypothetical protein